MRYLLHMKKYLPFAISAILLGLVAFLLFPSYQYYIDPDGTAYLTIARRYAAGDFRQAINGYWSPWSCWLTALLIKVGYSAIPASVIINTSGAAGFLLAANALFLRFNFNKSMLWLLNLAMVVFLEFAIFWQSFDDLWECCFLLASLVVMISPSFQQKWGLWILNGVFGALAYFAKAYAFPFFILNTLCCSFFISEKNPVQTVKITAASVAVMLILSTPWLYLLHQKYGIWTTSTAGSLNLSWYLVGHPHYKQGFDLFLPPTYSDSPYYWEDPYFANGETPHFWSSWYLLGLQLLRVGLNLWKLMVSSIQLSVFFPAIGIIALLSLRHKQIRGWFSNDQLIIVCSFLLFPMGYLLINFESRYLWYMLPLFIVLAQSLINCVPVRYHRLAFILLPISIIIYPLWMLPKMSGVGLNEYQLATRLRTMYVHGPFTARAKPGLETQKLARLAYFSGNPYCNMIRPDATDSEIVVEMRRNQVPYYLSFDGTGLGIAPERCYRKLTGIA